MISAILTLVGVVVLAKAAFSDARRGAGDATWRRLFWVWLMVEGVLGFGSLATGSNVNDAAAFPVGAAWVFLSAAGIGWGLGWILRGHPAKQIAKERRLTWKAMRGNPGIWVIAVFGVLIAGLEGYDYLKANYLTKPVPPRGRWTVVSSRGYGDGMRGAFFDFGFADGSMQHLKIYGPRWKPTDNAIIKSDRTWRGATRLTLSDGSELIWTRDKSSGWMKIESESLGETRQVILRP